MKFPKLLELRQRRRRKSKRKPSKETEPEVTEPMKADTVSTEKVSQIPEQKKTPESPEKSTIEPMKEKESSRKGGDDILRAAMDAIGGADNFSETPSMMPLPPVATIAGKQFFASFPLSIPFSLPVSIPVFGRLTSSMTKMGPSVNTTMGTLSGVTFSQTAVVSSTSTTASLSPQKKPEAVKPVAPQKETPPARIEPPKVEAAKSPNEPMEQSESSETPNDPSGDGSSSESTLPFRKRRAATTAGKSSCDHSTNSNSNFDEGNSSEFNIINHILQIEENMKPSDKSSPVNGTAKLVDPIVVPADDDEESEELENFAKITEQVLNDLNSENNSDEEALTSNTTPASVASDNFSKAENVVSSSFASSSQPEANVTSLVEEDPVTSISGPNATLVSSNSSTIPFQPYLDHSRETTPPRITDMTQVPPVITGVPYNLNQHGGGSNAPTDHSSSQALTPTSSVNISQPWY